MKDSSSQHVSVSPTNMEVVLGLWQCDQCTYLNTTNLSSCSVCFSVRDCLLYAKAKAATVLQGSSRHFVSAPVTEAMDIDSEQNVTKSPMMTVTLGSPSAAKDGPTISKQDYGSCWNDSLNNSKITVYNNIHNSNVRKAVKWKCSHCNFLNIENAAECVICTTSKEEATQRNGSGELTNFVKELSSSPKRFRRNKLKWKCDKCHFLNVATTDECVICTERRVATSLQSASLKESVSGSKTTLPLTSDCSGGALERTKGLSNSEGQLLHGHDRSMPAKETSLQDEKDQTTEEVVVEPKWKCSECAFLNIVGSRECITCGSLKWAVQDENCNSNKPNITNGSLVLPSFRIDADCERLVPSDRLRNKTPRGEIMTNGPGQKTSSQLPKWKCTSCQFYNLPSTTHCILCTCEDIGTKFATHTNLKAGKNGLNKDVASSAANLLGLSKTKVVDSPLNSLSPCSSSLQESHIGKSPKRQSAVYDTARSKVIRQLSSPPGHTSSTDKKLYELCRSYSINGSIGPPRNGELTRSFRDIRSPIRETWDCVRCTFRNSVTNVKCQVCEAPRKPNIPTTLPKTPLVKKYLNHLEALSQENGTRICSWEAKENRDPVASLSSNIGLVTEKSCEDRDTFPILATQSALDVTCRSSQPTNDFEKPINLVAQSHVPVSEATVIAEVIHGDLVLEKSTVTTTKKAKHHSCDEEVLFEREVSNSIPMPSSRGSRLSNSPLTTWTCVKCTFINKATDSVCEVCGGSRLNSTLTLGSSVEVTLWKCPSCTLDNSGCALLCVACQQPMPANVAKLKASASNAAIISNSGVVSAVGGRNRTSMSWGQWRCPSCTFENDVSEDFCQMCCHPHISDPEFYIDNDLMDDVHNVERKARSEWEHCIKMCKQVGHNWSVKIVL